MKIKFSPSCFAFLAALILLSACTDYRRKPYAYNRKRHTRFVAATPQAGGLPATPLVAPAADASAVVQPGTPSIPPTAAPPIPSIPTIPAAPGVGAPAAAPGEAMAPAGVPGLTPPAPAGDAMVPGATPTTPMVPGATPPPP